MSGKECCEVDAIVSVDSKGQIVLPKDLREKARLKPNDKLAIICCERGGALCCMIMVKAEELGKSVKGYLGPIIREIFE